MTVELLTDKEAAALLRRSPETIARWRRSGLKYLRGKPCLVRLDDLLAYLEEHKQPCSSRRTSLGFGKSGGPSARQKELGAAALFRRGQRIGVRLKS